MSSERPKTERLLALEGLRGIAAIIVVIFHTCMAFLPAMMGISSTQHFGFEDNVYNSPLIVAISGTFSVSIFFVLSGFVLSIGFFQTGNDSIIKKLAAKRYFRLMIPALASILFVWLLMSLGLMHNVSAAQITQSSWLATYQDFIPNLFVAIYQGIAGIFTTNAGAYTYNNVTWTMLYEFTGSIMVFLFCLIFGKLRYRWLIYIILLFVTFNTWFVAFALGLILADLYANRHKYFDQAGWWVYTLIAGLFLGGYSLGTNTSQLYKSISVSGLNYLENQSVFLCIGAFLVVASILASPILQRVLTKISVLGKYTFSLYLVHLPILYSLCSGIFLLLSHRGMQYAPALAISVPIFFVVTAGFAWLFERYVDAPAIRLSNKFAALLLSKDKNMVK